LDNKINWVGKLNLKTSIISWDEQQKR